MCTGALRAESPSSQCSPGAYGGLRGPRGGRLHGGAGVVDGERRHRRGFRPIRQRHRWYHISMEKTTLYLPEDLKMAVKRAASERGVPEAEIIRESIRASVGGVRPRPRGALYSSGQSIARRAEELLAGFGER